MSRLSDAVAKYIEIRRAVGYKLQAPARLLADFVRYMEAKRASIITVQLALDWARRPSITEWAKRLGVVRCLARHLHAEDPRHQTPPPDLIVRPARRRVPVLFRASEVTALLRAARGLKPPLSAATYETLFGLLAVTGMRIGEALRLDRNDLDCKQQLVIVRNSKFGKSRELVLHPSVVRALRRYAELRDARRPRPRSPAFFVSLTGNRLSYTNANVAFHTLARVAGVRVGVPHDLRHTFAVATLVRWYRQGIDIDAWMPRLSTYLGHVKPAATYWYLTASPELMAAARRQLDRIGGLAS